MTGRGLDGRIVVRTARCRTRRGDRGRVQDALDRVDLDVGLPRSAILVVRRLTGTLVGNPPRLDGVGLRGVAASAHRASVAPPPADCDAVLFSDEAELLVSLCRDVAGRQPLGWWWTTLLGSNVVTSPLDHVAAVAAGLDRFPRAIPAAVALAPRAVAVAAARLPDVEVLRITGAMAAAHGARPLADAVHQAWQEALSAGNGNGNGNGRSADTRPSFGASPSDAGADARVPDARRRGPASAAPVGAPPLVALLVDAALLLHRDPVGARSNAAATTYSDRLAPPVATGAGRAADGGTAARLMPEPAAVRPPRGPASEQPPAGSGESEDAAGDGRVADEPPAQDPDSQSDTPTPERADEPTSSNEVAADEPDPPADDDTIATALGGAFYLLNSLESLDLPDSADGPGEPGALLNRWGVLALVLRAWPDVDLSDSLFPFLDQLAWPDHDTLPAELHPDEPWVYRPPPAAAAFEAIGPDSPDLRPSGPAPGPYDLSPGGAGPDASQPAGPLRWGADVARLLQALLARRGLDPSIVHVPARVEERNGFSVRVHMALDDVDMDVRRAGIDRDPGWVPALGRVVELIYT